MSSRNRIDFFKISLSGICVLNAGTAHLSKRTKNSFERTHSLYEQTLTLLGNKRLVDI